MESYTSLVDYKQNNKDKFYLVTGKSVRGFYHVCIYQNGNLYHDPHPSRAGLIKDEIKVVEFLEKI